MRNRDEKRAGKEGISVQDYRAMKIMHQRIDERSRAMDRLIAEKIYKDPGLMENVRAHISHKLDVHLTGGCRTTALEWKQILDEWPLERILSFIQEDSPLANRLRQSSPFVGILTDEERRIIYQQYDPRTA